MALTEAEQAELDRLIAQKVAPEPRTETGVVGVLHALIDTASGAAANRSGEEWAALHRQAEKLAAPVAAEVPVSLPPATPPPAASGGTEGTGFSAG